MAYFNEEYILEIQSSSKDSKVMSNDFKKASKYVEKIISSEEFAKNFTSIPTIISYDEDDDHAYVFGDFLRGKTKYLCLATFDRSDIESGAAKDTADFIIKSFNTDKATNNIIGNLKISDSYGCLSIDYKF